LVTVSNSTAAVTGTVTPNGAQTTYWYDYGLSNTLGLRTSAQGIGSGFIATRAPAFITGLSANTTYYYRIEAENAYGTVTGDIASFTTNSNPPPSGQAPAARSGSASNISRTSANLSATVNPHGSDATVWFEYGPSSSLGYVTSFQDAGSGTSNTSLSVALSGLQPSTTYYFRIDAQNVYGTVSSALATFTTTGPATPAAPAVSTAAATSITSSSASLNGLVNPDGNGTTYWFEYGTNSLLGNVLGTATASSDAGSGTTAENESTPITGLARGVTYYYRIVARNDYGTVYGDSMTFKTSQ
ncbi:MAG: hypothetical protein ACREGR_02105, partial [Minisyncoccia bacterium]